MIVATVHGEFTPWDNSNFTSHPNSAIHQELLARAVSTSNLAERDRLMVQLESLGLDYGLADSLDQVNDRCPSFFSDPENKFILVYRHVSPGADPNFRPHKHGAYIGAYANEVDSSEYLTRDLIVFNFVKVL